MLPIVDSLTKMIAPIYMNKSDKYDKNYFIHNHLRHLHSFYAPVIRLYYRYIASNIMANPARLTKSSRVLDIGCGVGILVSQFNKLGYDAVGVDVNKAAIDNSISPNKCFLVETTSNLHYPNNHFDLVVSREVLEHIPPEEIDNCITEWDRVCKGRMVHIIAVSERGASAIDDPTHVNVQSETWWTNKFRQHDYDIVKNPAKFFFSPFGSTGYMMAIRNNKTD